MVSALRVGAALLLAAMLAADGTRAQAAEAQDPRPEERGFPLMRLFDDIDHGGAPQNFGVTTDSRGYVYVGNLQGVLIWDGSRWRQAPSETAVYKIASSGERILAGGPQSLLVLEASPIGAPILRSIVGLLPEKERAFGDVRSIVAMAEGFGVLTDERLLFYDGRVLKTLVELPRDATTSFFMVGTTPYLNIDKSLRRFDGGPLPPGDPLTALDGHVIDAVVENEQKAILAVTRDLGLVRVEPRGLVRVPGKATEWALANVVSSAARLREGRIAFGSKGGGVLLANGAGETLQIIDSRRGLPDDQVRQLTQDLEGGLWVALNAGLARLDVASPITAYDARAGVLGGSQGIYRHRGRLFVFSSAGLGVMESGVMRRIPGVAGSTWFGLDLREAPEDFLVAAAAGVFRIHQDRATLLPGTADMGAYVLAHAVGFEGVLVGARGGLHLLLKSANGPRLVGPLRGSPRYVRAIAVTRTGRTFFSTVFDGIVAVDFDPKNPADAHFQKLGGLEGDIHESREGLLAITNDDSTALFTIDEAAPKLVPDLPRTRALAGLAAWASASDAQGNLWVNTNPLRVFPREGGALRPEPVILHAFPARRIQMIRSEPDGVVWVGGEAGLYRHVGPPGAGPKAPPSPVVAGIHVDDRQTFDGWVGNLALPESLPQNLRRLRIAFGSLSQQRGLAYQFRLEPVDQDWSDWSARTDVEFTTLQEANYRFQVRTRGADGQVGPVKVWEFGIAPPWHRTLVARLSAVLGLALFVTGAVALRTRVLHREARLLSERVEERTRDLQQAVRDLEDARKRVEEQNRLLGEANARLEDVSRHDSLTGISNRRQFDIVLHEEWLRARRDRTPLSVGILDLDHFKDLNDTYGHPEGDVALKRVAEALQATMRRPADTVARYGGEEFAFILPETDLQGAMRVAEDARARIEALALRNPGSPSGHLTASVGLVIAIPVEGLGPERLVEVADRALYAAKSGGRNRIEGSEIKGPSAE